MAIDLEIKVLFCYSPQVLQKTYSNLNELKTDNKVICDATTGILGQNINRGIYKIRVLNVGNHEVKNLQKINGTMRNCLTHVQMRQLVIGLATNASYIVPMYGSLLKQLLILKNYYKATVVVLQLVLCQNTTNARVVATSGKIDIINSNEAFIAIGRTVSANPTVNTIFWLLAHEFGHLMGCRHPYGVTAVGFDNAATGNNHGHCFINSATNKVESGTLMSYAYPPVLYYSNPNLFAYPQPHENDACGEVGKSEAYKTVNANIQKLAGIF